MRFTGILISAFVLSKFCSLDAISQNLVDNIVNKKANYGYEYSIERVGIDTSFIADYVTYYKLDTLNIIQCQNKFWIENNNWSLNFVPALHSAFFKQNNSGSTYLYSPEDFMSIVLFAQDSLSHVEQSHDEQITIFLKSNALMIEKVEIESSSEELRLINVHYNFAGYPKFYDQYLFQLTPTIPEEVYELSNSVIIDGENVELIHSLSSYELIKQPF